jgi:hypothetical protein
MDYIVNNYIEILAVIGAFSTAAAGLAALTPNKKDDAIVAKVQKVLDFLALNFGKK